MKESTIEAKVSQYAKSKGWLPYKFVSPSNNGVPDRIFLRAGIIVFVEFKTPGKQPTALQMQVINKIRKQGFNVYVIDNVEEGQKMIDQFEK